MIFPLLSEEVYKDDNVVLEHFPEADNALDCGNEAPDTMSPAQAVINDTPSEHSTAAPANQNKESKIDGWIKLKYFLESSLIVMIATVLTVLWITRKGMYPWGSDSWYHLFKGHFLYKEVMAGNLFPLYTDTWYNGIQPLRYWAPLPHYILGSMAYNTSYLGDIDRSVECCNYHS